MKLATAWLCVCAFSLQGGQALPPLDGILARIQANLAEFDAAIPDFVANETVWSRKVVNGKIARQTVTESVFTCISKPQRGNLGESREVTAIDGKPVRQGRGLKGPFVLGGGFRNLLVYTFAANNVRYQDFTVAGTELSGGKPAVVVAFATKKGQRGMGFQLNGRGYITKDTGKAWIDPESMQILRLERKYSDLPGPAEVTVRVDYAPAMIDGKSFWLPKTVNASHDKIKAKNGLSSQFAAEYRDYRKFVVSSEITYESK